MAVNVNTGFDNNDRLLDIRQVVLNPIAVKVASLEDKMNIVKPLAEQAFTTSHVDIDNKTIEFHSEAGGSIVNLEGMFGEGSDLTVVDGEGKTETKVKEIKLTDSLMIKDTQGGIEMMYDWSKMVKANQDKLVVGKASVGTGSPTKSIFFKGPSVSVTQTTSDITTVEFPEIPKQLTAQLSSASTPEAIDSIFIDGNIGTSAILNGKLTIDLPAGGGVTPLSNQNFLGFFDTLGDLTSFIQNPTDGKSFAFVKDSKLGGAYYTPYFFINSSWKELKQDPALTYEDPKSPTKVGVFSIKPSDKISVDSNGQMNLDGLSTPQIPSHFKGFFDTLEELKAAVPKPVYLQDWAYVRNSSTNGLLAYRADKQGTATKWNVIAPLGSLAVIDRSATTPTYAQAFGIEKNDSWVMDSKGILSLKPVDTKTEVIISSQAGTTTGGNINKIKFESGKPYAEVSGTELIIKSPQQVINYAASWEDSHKVEDYRGSIFYDATSKAWMGCNDPDTGGGVDVKWTRLFHRNMSDDVKGLVRRVPAKAPDVDPGVLGDSGLWHFNGVTFLDKDNEHLPDDFKDVCGGYITTVVQDKDASGVSIPQYRMQTCTPDRVEGGTWVRRFISTSSPGAQTSWSPWVRTSFSPKDIAAHSADPGAHKEHIKFYKVTSFSAQYKTFYNQQEGGSAGGVRAANCSLIADNYGALELDQDYMQPAYDGRFKMRGVIGLAGYNDGKNLPANGQWNILVRLKHEGESSWTTIGHFRSEATPVNTKKFPILGFAVPAREILKTDQIIINITHTNTQDLITNHPGLYFVPLRSVFVLEDESTISGTRIARTFGKYIGLTDIMQGVGLRVHHADLTNPKSTVRVYGEATPDTVTPMQVLS